MADVPTKVVTLQEMVKTMDRYAADETFRWHAVDDANLRVTMGQAREELDVASWLLTQLFPDDDGTDIYKRAYNNALHDAAKRLREGRRVK